MTRSSIRHAFAVLLSAVFLLAAPIASAQMKIAVVDVQRAVMETEEGLRAQATLKKLFDRRQRELDARQNELKRARADIEKQSKVLSKEALQRRMNDWQQNMAELQAVFMEFNKELQKQQNKLTQPILNRVLSVLRQIAAQEGYDAILERNAVPYARTDLDITDRVIQRYNTGGRTPPPATSGAAPKRPPPPPAPGSHTVCGASPNPGVALASPSRLKDLAREFGGEVDRDASEAIIERVTAPEDARAHCLVPILQPKAVHQVADTHALLLAPPSLADRLAVGRRWLHPFARWILAKLLEAQGTKPLASSISPHAIVEAGATVGQGVSIGHGAVVLADAVIGPDCVIEPRAVLYGGVRLGKRVSVGAGAVIGRPGFGWAHGPDGQIARMPQPGGVVVDDDVEIGPLATVDAGTLKPTRLRQGCKLDAQVHVGHNADIGQATIVAAQSGFAGSVTVGHHVLVGGQVGVADHATIGDHARLAGRSGVIGPIAPHATVAGYPAVDRLRWLRAVARMMRGQS